MFCPDGLRPRLQRSRALALLALPAALASPTAAEAGRPANCTYMEKGELECDGMHYFTDALCHRGEELDMEPIFTAAWWNYAAAAIGCVSVAAMAAGLTLGAGRREPGTATGGCAKVCLTICAAAVAFFCGAVVSRLHCVRHSFARQLLPEDDWGPGQSVLRTRVAALEEDNAALRKQVVLLQRVHGGTAVGAGEAAELQHVQQHQETGRRWAFVTLAYDPPGRAEHFWQVIPIARALQHLSSYPLLVLTNTTQLPDGTWAAPALRKLNAYVVPVFYVERSRGKRFQFAEWNVAFWKLQIWRLTQYERLIWLDADSILFRSIDSLFERPGMWAQRDDWFCKMKQPRVCSGIMLLHPNASDYEGMLKFDNEHDTFHHGDQELIYEYFRQVRGISINLLDDVEASFGQCLGKASTPYRNSDGTAVRGAWNTPSFIHKSGGWGDTDNNIYNNVCFSHNLSRQYYAVGAAIVNICHYHPLGAYWRNLFCEAAAAAELRHDPSVGAFCSDRCWYHGGLEDCRMVDVPVIYNDAIFGGPPGLPELELEEAVAQQVGV